jgi:hypothetical protein
MTRSTVLETMREDYIRTAWAKGLQERAVVVKHASEKRLPAGHHDYQHGSPFIGGLVV